MSQVTGGGDGESCCIHARHFGPLRTPALHGPCCLAWIIVDGKLNCATRLQLCVWCVWWCSQAEHVIELLYENPPEHGLYPTEVSTLTGKPVNSYVTFGSLSDSFYEYLVKSWIQVGAVRKPVD